MAAKIARIAKRQRSSESDVVRHAIEAFNGGESAANRAGDLIGSVDFVGATDLSSNKDHLAEFGQ